MSFPYIYIYRLNKLGINKVVFLFTFRVYLSLLNCSGINISFFYSLFINSLLLPFCNICYLPWPVCVFCAFTDNFKYVLYAFLLLPSLTGKINTPGSVHSSKLVFLLSLNSRLKYITITFRGFYPVKNI